MLAEREFSPEEARRDQRRSFAFFNRLDASSVVLREEAPGEPPPCDNIIQSSERMRRLVLAQCGHWNASLVHLCVGAIALMSCRPAGVSVADVALLLHICLGMHEPVLRAHHGSEMWLFSAVEHCWMHHDEAVPWDVLRRLQSYFTCLCGLFRSLPEGCKR